MSPGPPAVVLAAGLGTRLDPLTRLVAKPAVPIGDGTLIERVLEWLARSGVRDVVMNLHHRPETLTAVLGDGAHLGMRLRYSWEDPVLGSAGGPARALSLLSTGRLLVVNGDTLCPVDIDLMSGAHERSGADVTLAVIPNPDPERYNGLLLDDDDFVRGRILKGADAHDSWLFVGVQIAEADVFSAVDTTVASDTIPGLYLQMAMERAGSVRAWRADLPFVDVGTPIDYLHTAVRSALSGTTPDGLTRCVVWPEARIGAGVTLEDCIVAGRVSVPAGFSASRSILVPATALRPGEAIPTIGDMAVFPLA
jgi:mannose-1-phosphate guanylyltransferase